MSELKRSLEVVNISSEYLSDTTNAKCVAILNVDAPTHEEIDQIRWNVNDKEKSDLNGFLEIEYDFSQEKVRDVVFNAYIDMKPEDTASIILSLDVESEPTDTEALKQEEL
jgi:hypothetical protein